MALPVQQLDADEPGDTSVNDDYTRQDRHGIQADAEPYLALLPLGVEDAGTQFLADKRCAAHDASVRQHVSADGSFAIENVEDAPDQQTKANDDDDDAADDGHSAYSPLSSTRQARTLALSAGLPCG